MTETTEQPWDVMGANRRVLFSGIEEDARAYVVSNFPRVHIEPGSNYGSEGPPADVALRPPNGPSDGSSDEYFVGGKWSSDTAGKHADPAGDE